MEISEKKEYRGKFVTRIMKECLNDISNPTDFAEIIANSAVEMLSIILIHTKKEDALEKIASVNNILLDRINSQKGEQNENVTSD